MKISRINRGENAAAIGMVNELLSLAEPPLGVPTTNCLAIAALRAHHCARYRVRSNRVDERLATLTKARERMVEERDVFAKVLAAPFDRDKAERARNRFIEFQNIVDSLDRAIAGEPPGPAPSAE